MRSIRAKTKRRVAKNVESRRVERLPGFYAGMRCQAFQGKEPPWVVQIRIASIGANTVCANFKIDDHLYP